MSRIPLGVDFEILKVAERVNEQRIDRFLEKVHRALWIVKEKLAILGLAFKFNTDDIRFSPALDVARRMIAEGADVHFLLSTQLPRLTRVTGTLPAVRRKDKNLHSTGIELLIPLAQGTLATTSAESKLSLPFASTARVI
jgi:UDP-glucose 6-dehydrogenase